MPYNSTGTIQIKADTKALLELYKDPEDSWNTFMIKLMSELDRLDAIDKANNPGI